MGKGWSTPSKANNPNNISISINTNILDNVSNIQLALDHYSALKIALNVAPVAEMIATSSNTANSVILYNQEGSTV